MRRRKLAFVLAFLMAVTGGTGIGLADPPEGDPTCQDPRNPSGNPAGECPGDNGAPAENALCSLPEEAENDGTELARDIILPGAEGECE